MPHPEIMTGAQLVLPLLSAVWWWDQEMYPLPHPILSPAGEEKQALQLVWVVQQS